MRLYRFGGDRESGGRSSYLPMENKPTETDSTSRVEDYDPYQASAGDELERLIHRRLFGELNEQLVPKYSRDERESKKVADQLPRKYGGKLLVGTTTTRPVQYLARLETGLSNSIEAIAEYEALAICRLAAVLVERDRK
jgi:hypothetical protein